jgi:hypothetical protein
MKPEAVPPGGAYCGRNAREHCSRADHGAVRLGADTIRVEYRNGYEEISVLKGGVGFEIARWPSSGRRAVSLHKELVGLRKKRAKATVSGAEYERRTHTYHHFHAHV